MRARCSLIAAFVALGIGAASAQSNQAPLGPNGSAAGGSFSTICSAAVSTQLLYDNAGACGSISGWTTNGSTTLVGGAGTTLVVGAGSAITSSGPGGALTSLAYTTPGTGVVTALGLNVGSAGAFIPFNGAGGTPSSMVGTNITGTAAGLTSGNVTTNANLTGPITSVGNATTINSQTGTGSTFVMSAAPTITGAMAASGTLAIGGATIGTNALAVTGMTLLTGAMTFNGSIDVVNNNITRIGSLRLGGASNIILTGQAAATLQFGNDDAAVAVAQTIRVQSVVAGTAAANGANWTFIGSLPTGTGTSGDIIFQTGVKTGSGTTQGTATTALTIKGETQALVTAALDASGSTGGALQVAGGASVAKRFWIPAITASAGLQTAVLCQSSGGEMIADSVACLASGSQFKTILGPMEDGALGKLMKLPMDRWAYKAEGNFKSADWTRERIGPIAQDVAAMDKRLAGYDNEGNIRTFSTEQLLAFTIKAVQELNAKVEARR